MAAPVIDSMRWYSWGANSYGQLCLGHCDDQLLPQSADALSGVSTIYGGGGHTFPILEDKQTLCCGWNTKGQLGVTSSDVTLPIPVESSHRWTKIGAGWDFTVAISDGELFSWGSNAYGQLGVPDIAKYTHIPTKLNIPKVSDVACGLRHTVICTESGDVMSCGSGKKGQLGGKLHDGKPAKEQREFHNVQLPHTKGRVSQVVAGAYHSAALTDAGEILVWGDNKHGQLGFDPNDILHILEPRILVFDFEEKVTELYTGWTHMLVVTDKSSVFTWGRGDYGQLGRPLPSRIDFIPKRIEVEKPSKIVLGSEHNLLLTEDGKLFSWGWNEHGLCATGDEVNVVTPKPIAFFVDKTVTNIGCGMGHCFACVEATPS